MPDLWPPDVPWPYKGKPKTLPSVVATILGAHADGFGDFYPEIDRFECGTGSIAGFIWAWNGKVYRVKVQEWDMEKGAKA